MSEKKFPYFFVRKKKCRDNEKISCGDFFLLKKRRKKKEWR
jgi:hypothetical protein